MKTLRAIAFLVSFGSILPALAQSGPADKPFSYFVAAARSGVESLKATVIGERQWPATEEFPGAAYTCVDRADGELSLLAMFQRQSSADAASTFDELVELAKKDLSEGWKLKLTKTSATGGNLSWRASFSKIAERVRVSVSYSEISTRGWHQYMKVQFVPQ